ncbi:MAG: hypothetical protein QM777_15235 [Pseudorhodoferax sp.]
MKKVALITGITGQDATDLAAPMPWPGRIVYDHGKPDGTPRKLMDSGRLHAMGWQARTGLEEGIARSYRDFLARSVA